MQLCACLSCSRLKSEFLVLHTDAKDAGAVWLSRWQAVSHWRLQAVHEKIVFSNAGFLFVCFFQKSCSLRCTLPRNENMALQAQTLCCNTFVTLCLKKKRWGKHWLQGQCLQLRFDSMINESNQSILYFLRTKTVAHFFFVALRCLLFVYNSRNSRLCRLSRILWSRFVHAHKARRAFCNNPHKCLRLASFSLFGKKIDLNSINFAWIRFFLFCLQCR